jgi:hypothetical protein
MLCAQAHISGGLVAPSANGSSSSSSSGVDVVAAEAEEQVQGGTIHCTLLDSKEGKKKEVRCLYQQNVPITMW